MSENGSKGFKLGLLAVILLIGGYIAVQSIKPTENTYDSKENVNFSSITFLPGYKFPLEITVPDINITHYSVLLSSEHIYLDKGYYDVKTVPQSREIVVHRSTQHQISILYWEQDVSGIYILISMGVYE